MTTIVNTPSQSDNGGSLGTIIGVFIVAILAIVFFVYALPLLRNAGAPQAPAPQENKIDVKIPDSVDINVKQPENPNP